MSRRGLRIHPTQPSVPDPLSLAMDRTARTSHTSMSRVPGPIPLARFARRARARSRPLVDGVADGCGHAHARESTAQAEE
jgi:hypothetical protein